ncbi:unnamed protein product, partial [Symbiodinium necroappetens]
MNTTFDEQRKDEVLIGDPQEVDRGDHRSTPENPITSFSIHPTAVTGQEHTIGDTSYLSETAEVPLRGGAAWLDYRDSLKEAGHKEMRKAIEEEGQLNLEESEISGCATREARAHCASWEPVPESGNIPGVYVAKPTIGNSLKAMRDRHFKVGSGVGVMTALGKRHIQRACSLIKQQLMQSCVDSGAITLAYDILETLPQEFKSGKWTEERRMGEMMRNYDHACSMDFGAFDGSCTKECRDLIENDVIISMFMKIMSAEGQDSLLNAAIRDRIKNKASISVKNVVKAVIWDMIRESGDRRTSILNFITNLTLVYANMSLMLEKRGVKEKVIKQMITDSLKCGSLANLMGEGDDGLQVFADAFVTPVGDKYSFGTEWCKGYAEYGFKIEPQGPTGDLEYHEC